VGYISTTSIEEKVAEVAIAKLFRNGRSQAVRLPREFRFEGDRVRIRRIGRGVLLEPVDVDVKAWFAEMDRLRSEPFMADGQDQPLPQERGFSW
jgi:antitoxin VapB